jgi:NADPH:quinone reductase-like Zn-dependent oxidoreductase
MQAYVCRRYGGPEVIELIDVPKPVPRDNEVLIRIHATTVSAGDWRVRTLKLPKGFGLFARLAVGFTGPRQPILGTELAGTIEAVGQSVTRFKVGDAVFAFPGAKMGSHAEYRAVAEDSPIALKPENLSFEESATLSFGGSTALHFLHRARIKRGESILVIGASGAVGASIVQLAKHFGAHVTGVTSTANLQLVSSLGADKVIDYTREDFTRMSGMYDIIADTVAATSYARCKHVLKKNGRLLAFAGGVAELLAPLWVPMTGSKRVVAGPAAERPEYVRQLAELARTGVIRPVIDRQYEFARMAEAHAYVETGRKRGSVVVRLEQSATR